METKSERAANTKLLMGAALHLQFFQNLIESGKVDDPIVKGAEYRAAIGFICERLESQLNSTSVEIQNETTEPTILKFLIAANAPSANDAISRLRNWLKGAKHVIICDPYFFKFIPNGIYPTVEKYASSIEKMLPKSATRIDIYSNGHTITAKRAVVGKLKAGRSIRHFSSSGIHDRFLIRDNNAGKIIGTSFGGFGSKFSVVVDLSEKDVKSVCENLRGLCPSVVGSRQ
ncbi:hypothetical protein [Jannaschia sp. W003]|uniref:hypothetical protein n=1 Tax=Jannaschia sp. W003 TaxID=2867012 RepID=UPI0021A7C3F8|nr:hypothetical protein [Jannaschia sp. W003]UWQ21629.1 hypothetical protein K3554_00955 [Jannaschia sp. W003]